jgi:hypothetical protein
MAKTRKPTAAAKSEATEQPAPVKKASAKTKAPDALAAREKTGEELVVENFAALSHLIETLGNTLELLTQKAENMAYHIIATEELLAELVADNGINLARVNTRIRLKVASGTDNLGNPGRAIDIAAAIASPLPRR